MLRMVEKAGDRLLSLAVPRIQARGNHCVHCTGPWYQVCRYVGGGWWECNVKCTSC